MASFLSAPRSDSAELDPQAARVHAVAMTFVGLVIVLMGTIVWVLPAYRARALVILGVSVAVAALAMVLNHGGRTRGAALTLVIGVSVLLALLSVTGGGVQAAAFPAFVLVVLLAGVLLGGRAAAITGGAWVVFGGGMVLLASTGGVLGPPVQHTPLSLWLIQAIVIGIAWKVQSMTAAAVREALARAESEIRVRRRAEERLEQALDAGGIGVWEHHVATNRTHADARAFGIFGRPTVADGVPEEDWLGWVHPDDTKELHSTVQGLAYAPGRARKAFRVVQPDGTVRHVETAAASVAGSNGAPESIVGMNIDVTDEVLAREESQRASRALVERVKELTLVHAAARLLSEREFGREVLAEVVSRIPHGWQYPQICQARITCGDIEVATPGWRDSPWKLSAHFGSANTKGLIEVVYLEERPRAVEGPFLREERALLLLLTEMLDTSLERAEAEAARRLSERKFTTIFQSSPVALTVIRLDTGEIIEANAAFLELYGAPSLDAVVGKTTVGLGIVTPEERERFILEPIRRGQTRGLVQPLHTWSGDVRTIELSLTTYELEGVEYVLSSWVDITERLRAEEALRLSELKFSTIFRESPVPLSLSDFDTGRLLEVNDAYLQQMGADSRAEVIGKTSVELGLITAESRQRDLVERAAGGRTDGVVMPVRTLRGVMRMAEVSVKAYEMEGRKYALTNIIDVTERLQAERDARTELAERRRVQHQLDLTLSAGGIGTWEFDPVERHFAADALLFEMFGIPLTSDGRVPYDTWAARVHPDDLPTVEEWLQALVGGQPEVQVDFRAVRPDGSESHVHSVAALLPAEEHRPARIVGVNVDITRLKLTELELRKHQEGLEALVAMRTKELERANFLSATALDLTKAGYWHVPLDGSGYWISSERTVEIHGDPPAPGMRYSLDFWAKHVSEADEAAAKVAAESFAAAIAGEIPRYDATYGYRRPADGRIVWLHAIGDVVKDADGKPTDMFGVSQDVTDFKDFERVLRASKDAAESANRAKGVFLAHMSHEIRTPMNAILGYAQLLNADNSLDAEQRRKVSAIHTSGDHLLSLLNDILEMSRIEAGRTTLSEEALDLPVLIDGVGSMFTELANRKGVSLDVEVAPELVRALRSDPGKIRQVLINLMGNAVKFTDRGRIVLRASSLEVGPERAAVTLEVTDTGPGIPADDLDVIFTAFGQSLVGRQRAGTGLGLAISQSFARLLGGDLTVVSEVGHGSTFTFTFTAPRIPEAGLDALRKSVPRELDPAETRRKALVVDDVPSNREILAESLSRAGFQIREAATGEEAIAMHEEWLPDLVMMDLHMPGIGGLAAIRQLRRAESKAAIVVATAAADDSTDDAVAAAGADALIRKPYRDAQLFEAISRSMGTTFVESQPQAMPARRAPRVPLATLLRDLPAELTDALRAAARQARAARLSELADRVAEHSAEGANVIRTMAKSFRYKSLLAALEETRDEQP